MPANSAPHPTYSPVKNGEREQPEFAARLFSSEVHRSSSPAHALI